MQGAKQAEAESKVLTIRSLLLPDSGLWILCIQRKGGKKKKKRKHL